MNILFLSIGRLENFSENGIISFRLRSMAECNDNASLTFKFSSASILIILGIPEVDTVILRGDIPKPSGVVIFRMASTTFL